MREIVQPRSAALGLAAIVAAACGVSLIWVFTVPIYQSPDEPAHLDYALTIYSHGCPFLAQNTSFDRLPPVVHPFTAYLQRRTAAFEISFSPGAKVEPGYGTADYFAALDRDAPPEPALVSGPNHLAAIYPFGYYTALAGWIGLVRLFSDSLTVTFFAARIFSVMLLAVTLTAAYSVVRLLGFSQRFALLLTAGVGLFPLTSFISSYVQPDNLSWTLVTLGYYFALRGRRNGWQRRDHIYLGLVLGGLVVTKAQFFVCTAVAVGAMLFVDLVRQRTRPRQWLTACAAVLLPSLLLGSAYVWSVWGTENYFGPPTQTADPLRHHLHFAGLALRDFFFGPSHDSFWGLFGWGDTPLVLHGTRTTFVVQALLWAFAISTLVLAAFWFAESSLRLVRLAGRKRLGRAIRVAVGNPVLNSLFLFIAVLTALFVRTENRFAAQGRNWVPVMLPVFLVGIAYAPRALTGLLVLRRLRTIRIAYTTLALTGLLVYDAVGGFYALKCVHDRFYLPFASVPRHRTSLSTEPAETRLAERFGEAWACSGEESYLGYSIVPQQFVHGIRLEFRVINEFRGKCTFRVAWQSGDEPIAPNQAALFCLNPYEALRGVTIWTNGPVRAFRVYPDVRPCQFEVAAITVLH
jgi:hypothetical protein